MNLVHVYLLEQAWCWYFFTVFFLFSECRQIVNLNRPVGVQNPNRTVLFIVIFLFSSIQIFCIQVEFHWILYHFKLIRTLYILLLCAFFWWLDMAWRSKEREGFAALKRIWWYIMTLNPLTAGLWHLVWTPSQLIFDHPQTDRWLMHLTSLILHIF